MKESAYLGDSKPRAKSSTSKMVGFANVTVYEFPMVIGDNPAVREGCPVRLGENLIQQSSFDVERFEEDRIGNRVHGKELYIPVPNRASILLGQGYTLDDIVIVVMQVEEVKKARSESLKLTSREKISWAIDSAGKVVRKLAGAKKQQQQQPDDDVTPNTMPARSA